MKYTVDHDATKGICLISVYGTHRRPDDSVALQEFARKSRTENGCCRFLFDMREAEITGTTTDILLTGTNVVRKQFEHDFRIALVYSGNMDDHRFLEDVVVNRGYMLRVFSDIEDANSWLLENGH